MPGEEFDPEKTSWVEHVGDAPKVYYFHNFLSEEERAHMIEQAVPYVSVALAVETATSF